MARRQRFRSVAGGHVRGPFQRRGPPARLRRRQHGHLQRPHGRGLGSRGAALDARPRQPHLHLRLAGGRHARGQRPHQRQGPAGLHADRGEGGEGLGRAVGRRPHRHGGRRRDRPGARRRVHLPRLPLQGGRRPLPHHPRHHRRLRRGGRGHQLRRHLGGGRQGLLQGDGARRQLPLHAVRHPSRPPRRTRQRPGARRTGDRGPHGLGTPLRGGTRVPLRRRPLRAEGEHRRH